MKRLFIIIGIMTALGSRAQSDYGDITVTGSIQSDILIPQEDTKIGAEKYKEWGLTNTYADVSVMTKHIDVGGRVEFMRFPLPGYEPDFKGWGLANIYARMHAESIEVTLGNFYEQFGSGFILRTYEERSLGIDNSLMGAKIVASPMKGVRLKALTGYQRRYWSYNDALVSGADLELGLEEWFHALGNSNTYVTLGGSWVNKREGDETVMADATHRLNLPKYVNAWDVRARLQKGGLSVLAEYAQKTQDPSFDNGYIYRRGYVAMLSASYSKRGMSALLQAKRSDNMSFRSRRSMNGTSSFVNHLPAFTMEHTYALAALYPYATQPLGEWAYQAELGYQFKRHTLLGGKYGTGVKVNFSHVHSLQKNLSGTGGAGTDGYHSAFWKWGDETYYQDLNVQVDKKLSKAFKLNLMYMNQRYNKTIVEGEGGMIHSNIFVAEGKYQFSRKTTLRGELQYLTTGEDDGDWAFGLLELSLQPHWMLTVSDMYNCGATKIHYYMGAVTFNHKSHRLQVGYARTRAGFNCSGGVCRYVPASKGVTVNYNYNF
ncbi:MAG: hypothetical protein IJV13_02740 [Prevotella sp.]|nr:hypothetical protein [Prevotella sp.]